MRWHLLILAAALCLVSTPQFASASQYPHRCSVLGKAWISSSWRRGRPIGPGRCPDWRRVELR
jgi:hypothetical protein